jgi:DNA-binding Xre family transcriptional regulator
MNFFHKVFICLVQDIYDTICEYVSNKWIDLNKESIRSFATDHDVDEKTVRRILEWKKERYRITLNTLEKICKSRGLTLEDFFKLIKR